MSRLNPEIDLSLLAGQFEGLRGRHPGLWPRVPKAGLLVLIAAVLLAGAWLLFWKGLFEELDQRRAEETTLRQQFANKMKQAANLPVLREQKALVGAYVSQLERQLPNKAEMDALLSDINQAGVGRGLQFELFKPGQVVVRDYYAELPISIRLSGSFHDFASFTSDLANMARIVTLQDVKIAAVEPGAGADGLRSAGPLVMEATARTFRYLDEDEIAEQRKKAAAARSQAGKKGAAAGAPR
jgi:type IV pilus assembly protein PilO